MTPAAREHRITELQTRFKVADFGKGKYGVRDGDTGELLPITPYDNEAFARARCKQEASRAITALFAIDRATAEQRVEAIIGEQSDRKWAATLIVDLFEGVRP
jgi:hypothetical protein